MKTFYSALLLSTCGVFLTSCGGGGSSPAPIPPPVVVTPPQNTAPTVSTANSNQSGIIGETFEYDATQAGATFTDADGDSLAYSVTFSPTAQGLSAIDGVISGTPAATGVITVTITADDGNGGTVTNSFDISILSLIHISEPTRPY